MSINAVSSAGSPASWEELFGVSNYKKEQQAVTKLFSALDSDGDGELSLEESGLDQVTYATLDINHDGSVSSEELAKLQSSAMLTRVKLDELEPQSGDAEAQSLLASVLSEMSGANAKSAGGQSVFDSRDTNQDGIVSTEELASAFEIPAGSADNGENFTGTGISGKAKDLLISLASRAYGAMSNTGTNNQTINLQA